MLSISKRDLTILSFAVVGAAAGIGLNFARNSTWQSLGRPPAAPYWIQAATLDTVFVHTAGGKVYAFRDENQSYWNEGSPAGRWTTQLPHVESWETEDCVRDQIIQPDRQPPLAVKDSISCRVPVEGSAISILYVILEDGNIWRWNTPLWPHTLTGPISLGILGALAGWLAGIMLLRLIVTIIHNPWRWLPWHTWGG